MPVFTFKNFTRYNTEDLLELLTSVESILPSNVRKQPGKASVYSTQFQLSKEIHVVYFGSAAHPERVSSGLVLKHGVLKIARPENLYDSPLQALASTTVYPKVPDEVRNSIAKVLLSFFDLGSSYTVPIKTFDRWMHLYGGGTLEVRIDKKAGETKSKSDKKALSSRIRAHKAVQRTQWAVRAVGASSNTVRRPHKELEAVASDLSAEQRELLVAVETYLSSCEALAKVSETLKAQE
jgi:hypothetical protein